MKKIVKMVNHELTAEQKSGLEGYEIIALPDSLSAPLKQCGADISELKRLADDIISFAKEHDCHLVLSPAGSPAFSAIFSVACEKAGIAQVFSHSVREFSEAVNEDGSVEKVNVFRHVCYSGLEEILPEREEFEFNDRQGNRDRSCRYCIVHNGEALTRAEAEEKGIARFIELSYEKAGKWSNSSWRVKLKDGAKLVVIMSPFSGWPGEMSGCLDHIRSNYGMDQTPVETLKRGFEFLYPKTYREIESNEKW